RDHAHVDPLGHHGDGGDLRTGRRTARDRCGRPGHRRAAAGRDRPPRDAPGRAEPAQAPGGGAARRARRRPLPARVLQLHAPRGRRRRLRDLAGLRTAGLRPAGTMDRQGAAEPGVDARRGPRHRREPRAVRLDARRPAGSPSAHPARHPARPGRGRHLCHLLVVRATSPGGRARPAGSGGIARPAAMGSVFGAGGALLLQVLLLTGAPLVASAQNLVVAGYMALVPMFLGYVLFGIGLTTVPASTATTVTLTEPAVATVLAVVIVGERLGPAGWAGLCLIGLVLIVLALAPTNLAPAEPTAPGTPVRGTPSSARRHAPSTAPQR